jgi:hypothetical protein
MTEQNPSWFAQNGITNGGASAPESQMPDAPIAAPSAAQPTPESAGGGWFAQNGIGHPSETQTAPAATGTDVPTRSTWDKIKAAVSGPDTALATPMGENKGNEISGINDIIHGEFAKGGSKIWNSEKIDAKNIAPGSPVEWAIRQFDPDFHGEATKEAVAAMKAKNQNPGEKPLVDIAQFVDKDKHPIGKALAEVGQGLTSPENLAIMYGTGGLGLVGKTPQALKALGVMNKLISAGFAYQALQGAYQHSKAFMDAMNAGDANEAEYQLTHALASGTMAVQAGSHAAEGVAVPGSRAFGAKGIVPVEKALPFLSDTDKAVLGKTAEVVGKAAEATSDFAKQKATDAADVMGRVVGRTDNFDQAITAAADKLGKKVGPEFKEKVGRVSNDLKDIINNDVDNKIVDPKTAADAIQGHLNSLEAPLQAEAGATRDSTEPVVPNFRQRLQERLDKFFDDNRQKYGNADEVDAIKDKIIGRLTAQYDVGGIRTERDPNLYEAENARQGFSKSAGDVFENGTSSGYRAATANIADFLRDTIDEAYDNKGVTNVKEVRQKEADLIDVRDALRDAQAKYEAQGNMPALLKLFTLGKGAALIGALGAHFFAGDWATGALSAGTAWKALHDHFSKNLPSNFNRAIDLANRDAGAQATTPGQIPPVNGPQTPPPNIPGAPPPNIPGAPPPPVRPAPVTPPAVNHALNGTLSSYFGNFLNEEPYQDLMQRFVNQVADMKQDIAAGKADPNYKPKYTQDQIDRAMKVQDRVNTEHAKEHAAVEKQNDAATAKYNRDYAKWEQDAKAAAAAQQDQASVKEAQDKAAAEAAQREREEEIKKDPRIAHSPLMFSLDRALPIEGEEGRTSPQAARHEHGHIMAATAEGLNPIAFVAGTHPDAVDSNAVAQVHTDTSDAQEGLKGLAQRVVTHLGGPAFDEVHQGIPLGRNTGARADIARARQILREKGGLSGTALEKVFDALYDRAKEHVSNPEAHALVEANADLRERGLHPNYHMSPGRLEAYVKLLKGVYNGKTPSGEGIREGATDGGVREGKPADAGGEGSEQNGAVEGVRAEAARESAGESEGDGHGVSEKSNLKPGVPPERTTGNEEVDKTIRAAGGIPGGTMKGFEYEKDGKTVQYPDTHLFHDPESGTTLADRLRDVTGEAVEKSDLTKGSTVPLMENPLKVKGTGENNKISTVDVAQALNKFSQKSHPALELDEAEPKEMVARAKKIAEDEAKYQLASGKTGTEWYTEEMKDHDAAINGMRPELQTGETINAPTLWPHTAKQSLFKAMEAILSSGQKPYGNVKSAVKAWDLYNETGEFPRTQPDGKSWGPRGSAAYANAMGMLNTLVGEKGEKGASEWLLSDHPVSELKQYNKDVKGKKDDVVPGAMILGAKRGPFMQNLHGIESAFTADMWVTRTWNRWMGTMETGKNSFTGEPEVQPSAPRNQTERNLMHQSFKETADKLGLSTSSMQAVLWYYEQGLYSKQGIPKESWSFRDAAQRVAKEQPNQEEQESFPHGQNDNPKVAGFLTRPSTFANISGK